LDFSFLDGPGSGPPVEEVIVDSPKETIDVPPLPGVPGKVL